MISIDFSYAIAIYLLLSLTALLMFWLFASKEKDKDLTLDPKFIWFCAVCTYAYINTKEEVISVCPRCGSYNKRA